jgi:ATP-binding cassette subfamily G (WHITE) protein 1
MRAVVGVLHRSHHPYQGTNNQTHPQLCILMLSCLLQVAVFLGPVIACLFSVFGFCIRFFDTPIFFRWLFHISYYRAGFQGIVYSIYGLNRQNLYCPEDALYCHYSDPTNFLKEMDITDVDLVSNISVIVVIWCIMHAATYLTLWIKLNKR